MATWLYRWNDDSNLPEQIERGWATDLTDWLGFSSEGEPGAIDALNELTGLNLSADQWYDFLIDNGYATRSGGFPGEKFYDVTYDKLKSDLAQMYDALSTRPVEPLSGVYMDAAKRQAYGERDAALSELDALKSQRIGMFNDELASLASGYNTARSGILSQQYQQNAQLMDTMTSQMDRTRRNALEAGASAGLRLAGNINTLLSTQNRQSQQSLETANQLAQMMVNQRNAEAAVRGQYGNYLSEDFSERRTIRNDAEAKVDAYHNREYGSAMADYGAKDTDWTNRYGENPFFEHLRYKDSPSKYNNQTGG